MKTTSLSKKLDLLPSKGIWEFGRSIVYAVIVGALTGGLAIAFHGLREAISYVGLDLLAGYRPSAPAGEQHLLHWVSSTPLRVWVLLFVPAIGGLMAGWLVYRLAPEAEGHGTDAAIDAYHNKRGVVRGRVPFVKMLASALTLGTGGSGGQEGPIAHIGAGCGSWLATKLKLTDAERRSLMAAGLGAGIGAIFHAPLAGAIFATEVLYRDPDFETENLIPALFATTVAYNVYCMVFGFQHLFTVPHMRFDNPFQLMPLTVMVGVVVMASLLYVKCFYGFHGLFAKLNVPKTLKPVIGGAATGVLGVTAYYTLWALGTEAPQDALGIFSVGYGYLQKVLNPEGSVLLVSVLLVVGLGKILATSLTIGSGGSAGVFAPSMVIGGTLGAVVGLAFLQWLPGLSAWWGVRVDVFAVLGMASFFAAAANTPVSTLIMVSEMTGSYELLLPAMWVCALAYLLGRRWTIFSEQVNSRIDSPAHRGDFVLDVLEGLTVRDAIARARHQFRTVPLDMSLGEIVHMITDTQQTCFPVVDAQEKLYGLFELGDVRQFLYDSDGVGDLAVAQDLARTDDVPLTLQTDLSSAIGLFSQGRYEELPVVDQAQPDKIIALLRRQDVIATYSARLLAMRKDQERESFDISST